MSQILTITLLCLSAASAYLWSISPFTHYTLQLIAAISVIFILTIKQRSYFSFILSLAINLIILTTNGLNSPFFFLIYFLLFTVAFQNPPSTTLSFSLFLILLLSQSLNSLNSLLPLVSLLFITPLAWFVGQQYLEKLKDDQQLAHDETDFLLWSSLKFKTGISQIIDSASLLLSSPQLNHSQKELVHKIKDSAKSLLNSSQKLTDDIDKSTDET